MISTMMKMLFLFSLSIFVLTGCVDYSKERNTSVTTQSTEAGQKGTSEQGTTREEEKNTSAQGTAGEEKKNTSTQGTAGEEKKNTSTQKTSGKKNPSDKKLTVVATSVAAVTICEKLGINLAGVPKSDLAQTPECYRDAVTVGSPMAPDMEVISSLKPDWILSPISLMSDLKPKYETIGADYAFLNLSSIQGMYRSIEQLGTIFDKEEEASKLVKEFTDFYDTFCQSIQGKEHPKVLILMGLPDSYVVAAPQSYVGNLVELAGGKNVYSDEEKDFINVNTEDMLQKEPDIILRTSHAMPEQVKDMFAKEFKENSIWKNFTAVKNGRVYDLSNEEYGMSANFEYQKGLNNLKELFY